MNYLPSDYARCFSTPGREQCKTCQRNINNSPLHPDAARSVWVGPWVLEGPCPSYSKGNNELRT